MNIQKILQWSIYAGLATLLFTPFVIVDGLFFPFITGKAYFFRIIVEIIFFLWLILAVMQPQFRPKKSWLLYALGAFMISIFISNVFGANWTASFWSNFERMEGYITLLHLSGLFLVASSMLQIEKHWRNIFNISLGASLIMVIVAFNQLLGNTDIHQSATRLDGTTGNSIYLAVYMLFHVFIALFYMAKQKLMSVWWWVYLVTIVLEIFILFRTSTRGAILGLIGGLILTALLTVFTGRDKKIKKVAISGLIAIVILIAGFFTIKNTEFVKNSEPLNRLATISIDSGTAQARILNWQIATEGFKERPVFGWGQSNYNYVFDYYYKPAMHGNEMWFDRTHNIIFDWLIAGGFIGLLLYLGVFSASTYLIWWKSKEWSALDKSIITGLLAAYFFHNLFVFDHLISYLSFFFILSYIHSQNSSEIKFLGGDNSNVRYAVISIAIVLLPTTIYAANVPSHRASSELIEGLRLTAGRDSSGQIRYYHPNGLMGNIESFRTAIDRNTFGNAEIRQRMISSATDVLRLSDNGIDPLKQQFAQTAIDEITKQMKIDPLDSKYPYLLGIFFAQVGNFELAEKQILKSIELSPNKQDIRVPLARIYLQTGQTEKALELSKETYELDTSKDVLWVEYVTIVSSLDSELSQQLIDEAMLNEQNTRVIMLLKNGVRLSPENMNAYVSLAAFHYEIGEREEALVVIDDAIERFPEASGPLNSVKQGIISGEAKLGESF